MSNRCHPRDPRDSFDPLEGLIRLVHRRWSLPVLAELAASNGGKFITLMNRLGVSRPTLRATLEDLRDGGWVVPNPGYGHPMRPEFILTAEGRELAPSSSRLIHEVKRLKIYSLALNKWTLPVTFAIGDAERRFCELRDELHVTPRALSLALRDMEEVQLVGREVWDDYPPVSLYRLEPRAHSLLAALDPVAQAV